MRNVIFALAAAVAAAGCAATPGTTATDAVAEKRIYVIRHLQKGEGADPSLTAEGAAGAQKLADLLADRRIVAIFATPTRRAMETAAPLAGRLGIPVTPYDPANPAALVAQAGAAGGSVLVVGHSNTVPDLVSRFGGAPQAPLSDSDYGTLFVVGENGEVTRVELR